MLGIIFNVLVLILFSHYSVRTNLINTYRNLQVNAARNRNKNWYVQQNTDDTVSVGTEGAECQREEGSWQQLEIETSVMLLLRQN